MSGAENVWIVDDDRSIRWVLDKALQQEGMEPVCFDSADSALARLSRQHPDVLISDIRMPGTSGLDLLAQIRNQHPRVPVIIMTAHSSVQTAVEAMRLGAFDYLQKPFSEPELLLKVQKALESRRLRGQVEAFAQEFRERYGFDNIIGRSEAIRNLLSRVVRIAPTDVTVLITGESGTGKELIARAVHANSSRAHKPFIPVNCAAITETLLESELFGHARGAFTGATTARKGLLEEADGGTFFFDEIAETTMAFQAKLLRTIQEGEVRRVGDNRAIKVNVRAIAATNVDLAEAVEEKRFREDLYYRLNVARFKLPPLRERREDIPLLVEFFLSKYNQRLSRRSQFAEGVVERLQSYPFPGNVRELENMVEQAVALASGGLITVDDVLPEGSVSADPEPNRTLAGIVDQAERHALQEALSASAGNREKAAEALGISATTLWRKMTRLGVTFDAR